jgi:hypothetical protein
MITILLIALGGAALFAVYTLYVLTTPAAAIYEEVFGDIIHVPSDFETSRLLNSTPANWCTAIDVGD